MTPAGSEWAQAAWTQTWQVTLLVVVVALVTRLLARNRPHLAYALWLVVLVKCLTPPLWSSPTGIFCWMHGVRGSEAANEANGTSGQSGAEVTVGDGRFGPTADARRALPAEPFPSELVVVARPAHAVDIPPARNACDETEARAPWPPALTWAVLIAVWTGGLLIVAGVATLRWASYWRLILRSACRADPTHDRLMRRLSRRLKLRRPVRLLVAGARIGPAVVGLLRPTVVLPEALVRGRSASDLEPILAHELIHVRRGDMWVGMLQTAARAVWWFHPLVRWSVRLISREAERCCDEEVVAELGCSPAGYARNLLDVLEQKRSLQPVPAFPGVRPVEVTSRRLERIMKLGQGSHRRAPWWCWAVMLMAALAVLPGAALVIAGDEPPDEKAEQGYSDLKPPIPVQAIGLDVRAAPPVGPTLPVGPALDQVGGTPDDFLARLLSTGEEGQKRIVRVYRVADVLARIRSDYRADDQGAKHLLTSCLARPGCLAGPPAALKTAESKPAFEWSDKKLTVRETDRGHRRIAEALKIVRKHGLSQIVIEAAFLRGPRGAVEAITGDWTLVPAEFPPADRSSDNPLMLAEMPHLKGTIDPSYDNPLGAFDRPLPDDGATQHSRARTVVEKRLPIAYQVMDEAQAADVRDRFQADRRINVLQAPKMALFNGQTALVSDTSQSPFVVGVVTVEGDYGRAHQPQIRVVPEGLMVRLRPLLREGDSLWLDWEVTLSKIRDVDLTTFASGHQEGSERLKGTTLQVPEVETTRLDASLEFPIGKTLLVSGMKTKDEQGNVESLLILIRASKAAPNQALAGDKDLFTRVYNVADLVVPVPHKILVEMVDPDRGYIGTTEVSPAEAQPDFASLVELFKSTVAPDTWDEVGGWGTIRPLPTNLSLVVSQREETHKEIVELLEQLRRMQDMRVTLKTVMFDLPRDEQERAPFDFDSESGHLVLDSDQVQTLMETVNGTRRANVIQTPPISLLNGQRADMSIPLGAEDGSKRRHGLLFESVIAEDRRAVRLRLAVNGRDGFEAPAECPRVAVPDGQALLVEITDRLGPDEPSTTSPLAGTISYLSRLFSDRSEEVSPKRVFVLVTPKIVVEEEDEERLAGRPRP